MRKIILIFLTFIIFSLTSYSIVIYYANSSLYISTKASNLIFSTLSSSPLATAYISSNSITITLYITNSTTNYFLNIVKITVNTKGYFYISNVSISNQASISNLTIIVRNSTVVLSLPLINNGLVRQSAILPIYPGIYNLSIIINPSGIYANSPISVKFYYSINIENKELNIPPVN